MRVVPKALVDSSDGRLLLAAVGGPLRQDSWARLSDSLHTLPKVFCF